MIQYLPKMKSLRPPRVFVNSSPFGGTTTGDIVSAMNPVPAMVWINPWPHKIPIRWERDVRIENLKIHLSATVVHSP